MALRRQRWSVWLAVLAWLVLAAPARPAPQESLAVSRLQQELDRLRNQTRFEIDDMGRELDRLQERIRHLEARPGIPVGPPPAPPRVSEPPEEASDADLLTLRDEAGRVRAVVDGGRGNGPSLALLDAGGTVRLLLDVDAPGPTLELVDERGRARLVLEVTATEALLTFRDRDGRAVARVGAVDGEPVGTGRSEGGGPPTGRNRKPSGGTS